MNRFITSLVAFVLGTALFASSVSAEIIGVYLRNGEEFILVRTTDDGLMYCTRVGDGYEMCDGIAQQPDGSWTGTQMKHPDMPTFMSFTGTVIFNDTEMLLEGCTTGNTQCEAEVWPKQ